MGAETQGIIEPPACAAQSFWQRHKGLLAVALSAHAWGQTNQPPATPAAVAPAATLAAAPSRDPFWPVGFTPPAASAARRATEAEPPTEKLRLAIAACMASRGTLIVLIACIAGVP